VCLGLAPLREQGRVAPTPLALPELHAKEQPAEPTVCFELIWSLCENLVGGHQEKQSPLHIAINTGHNSITKTLVEAKADVNLPCGSNYTYVMQQHSKAEQQVQVIREAFCRGAQNNKASKKVTKALEEKASEAVTGKWEAPTQNNKASNKVTKALEEKASGAVTGKWELESALREFRPRCKACENQTHLCNTCAAKQGGHTPLALALARAHKSLGLKWKEAGSEKPYPGTEIENEPLAEALQKQVEKQPFQKQVEKQVEFTKEVWQTFGVANLSHDSCIKAGNRYFKPAKDEAVAVLCNHGARGALLYAVNKGLDELELVKDLISKHHDLNERDEVVIVCFSV
jgi:hypothetical protein